MAKKKRAVSKVLKGGSVQNRMSVAWKSLLLFFLLFAVSFAFYYFLSSSLLTNLFGLLAIIFGFLALAFFIILIVLVVLKPRKR